MSCQQLLTDEIEHSCIQESSHTKEDASGIAQSSGRPDCDLGLIREQRGFGQDGVDQRRKKLARKATIAGEKERGERT